MISNSDITNAVNQYLEEAIEDGGVTLHGLQQLTRAIGIHNPEKTRSKIVLIQAIQDVSQGHICFRKYSKL